MPPPKKKKKKKKSDNKKIAKTHTQIGTETAVKLLSKNPEGGVVA